jgi:hypothetical protein
MQDSSKETLIAWLGGRSFKTVLDAPSGGGWLPAALGDEVLVDGIDLYLSDAPGYGTLWQHDLDEGLPSLVRGLRMRTGAAQSWCGAHA